MDNINTQFATTRNEIRRLFAHIKPATTLGGKHAVVLQGMIDTLDSLATERCEVYSQYPLACHLDTHSSSTPQTTENPL